MVTKRTKADTANMGNRMGKQVRPVDDLEDELEGFGGMDLALDGSIDLDDLSGTKIKTPKELGGDDVGNAPNSDAANSRKVAKGGKVNISKGSTASLVSFIRKAHYAKHAFSSFTTKLNVIDTVYAAYKIKDANATNTDGIDIDSIIKNTDASILIAASQVDTIVAYLVEVFLSGSPIFPVVSGTKNKDIAEKFEAVIAYHGQKGKYLRELALVIKDAAKYDFTAVESIWDTMAPFFPSAEAQFGALSGTEIPLTKLRRLDPYNTIYDYRVPAAEVSARGEFAGYVEMVSLSEMKRELIKYTKEGTNKNTLKAVKSKIGDVATGMQEGLTAASDGKGADTFGRTLNYYDHPQISDYVESDAYKAGADWDVWLGDAKASGSVMPSYNGMYERTVLYGRIIPHNHGINVANSKTPQIWRMVLINGTHLIYAQPISTPYDMLPINIGQPLEDGMLYQTKSITERAMPFQNAASDLYNIKINASKRAINDRMFYDPRYIDVMDINSPVPAAKIPVNNLGTMGGKNIKDVVMPVPFNDNGTSGALMDLQQTISMANMVMGINPFRQGQNVKGNRTKSEFEGVYDSSELRTRMMALMFEVHIMMPIKDMLKLNILLHNAEIEAIDFDKAEVVTLNPTELQNAVIEFKIADGYKPKDKLMSVEDLGLAFQFLTQMPNIAADYDVGDMFVHLMSLKGVKGLKDYKYTEETKQGIINRAMPLIQQMQQQQAQADAQDGQGNPATGGAPQTR